MFNSGQDRDGEVEATEHGVGEDLETFRHRQGWITRRRRVRTRHAPHPGQNRRTRPAFGIATTPRSSFQAQLKIIIILNRCYIASERHVLLHGHSYFCTLSCGGIKELISYA